MNGRYAPTQCWRGAESQCEHSVWSAAVQVRLNEPAFARLQPCPTEGGRYIARIAWNEGSGRD